jgi:hypothetical protein
MNQIIFHIHGGGFVSQSSFVHQMYIRKWAKTLGVPIFSVDYRKAPAHPYPSGLDDCFQTYMWLLHYLDQVFSNRIYYYRYHTENHHSDRRLSRGKSRRSIDVPPHQTAIESTRRHRSNISCA